MRRSFRKSYISWYYCLINFFLKKFSIVLLASISIKKGHQVQIYDANAWRKSDSVLKEVCMADNWDVIAIGGITTAYGSIKKIIKIAKNESPTSKIVLGGGVLTSIPKEIMFWLYEVDIGVIGASHPPAMIIFS